MDLKVDIKYVVTLLVMIGGWMFWVGATTKSFEKEDEKMEKLANQIIKLEKQIEKVSEYLNGEDDGVRGDFGVGDENIREFEDLRSEKDKLEIKVWFYENSNSK
jgi:hypothetical protein